MRRRKIKARDIQMQIMTTFKWICPMTMTKKPCPQKPQCSHQKRIIQPTVNSSVTVVVLLMVPRMVPLMVPLMAHQTNHDHHPNTDQALRPPRSLIDINPPIDNQPTIDNLPPLIDNLEGRQMINQIIRRQTEK